MDVLSAQITGRVKICQNTLLIPEMKFPFSLKTNQDYYTTTKIVASREVWLE